MFTATAMCAPTRQQLYTGLFPIRNGAYPNHSRVYDEVRSLPHHLAALGYRVGLHGKQHFNPASSYPFEILQEHDEHPLQLNEQALKAFITRDTAQPWCLIVASREPHVAWNTGDRARYSADNLTVPPYLIDSPETRDVLVRYYAEITYLDQQLGRCVSMVEAAGVRENTIVIFTSEQGAQFPFGGKWTCHDNGLKTAFIIRWPGMIAPGTRTQAMKQYVDVLPTLLEAAGGEPGSMNAGRPDRYGRQGFDGASFLQVLRGRTDHHRDYVFGVHTTRGIINGSASYPIRSARSHQFKYIRNLNHEATFYNLESTVPDKLLFSWRRLGERDSAIAARVRLYQYRPAEEFYDIQQDPYELNNLADDATYNDEKRQLQVELDRWIRQQGDEGIDAELKANERQGANGNRRWKPYNPDTAIQ